MIILRENSMRTILIWFQGEKEIVARTYDDNGKLVAEKVYTDIRLIEARVPILLPTTLVRDIHVLVLDRDAELRRKGSILVIERR